MDVIGADGRAVRREILRLMAAGLTDEAIASRLGISARSARRHIAAIMDALGAVSRFQAGAEAARRGWLTGPAAGPDLTARPGPPPASADLAPSGQNTGRR
jgi:DNA-binding CsgD family transcriptional regulator